MKTAVSSWSYHRLLDTGALSWEGAVDHAASIGATGFECVLNDLDPDFAAHIFKYIREKGLEAPIYTTGANFLVPNPEAEVERVKKHIDVAAANGVTMMRHDVAWGFYEGYEGEKTIEAAVEIMAPAIREVAAYGESKGVITCSENHGRLFQDSDRVRKVYRGVNHKNYRFLCDIGNFGGVDEDCATATAALSDLICHVHCKDSLFRNGMARNPGAFWGLTRGGNYRRATIFGQGDNPTFQCLNVICSTGYDGYFSIEFEGIEDTLPAIQASHDNLVKMLKELGK